jgi:Zn-dependent protease
MLTLTLIQKIVVWVIPVLLAITLHEAAHAWVANRCGDPTAKMLGRLSINPLRHVALVGTIIVPIVVAILSQFQFIFGWAKPVPVNWSKLHNPRRDMGFVAIAGPLSNFIMALLWAGLFKIATLLHPETSRPILFLLLTAQAGIIVNLVVAFVNLIPIPPLDGSRIIASLLPPRQAVFYLKIERYGLFILIALLFTGLLNNLLGPALSWAIAMINILYNL